MTSSNAFLYPDLHLLLDCRIFHHQEPPGLVVATVGGADPGFKNPLISSSGTGSGFNRRIERVEPMISKKSGMVRPFLVLVVSFHRRYAA